MQINPLFINTSESSPTSGDQKNFRLDNCSYLFSDIIKVEVESTTENQQATAKTSAFNDLSLNEDIQTEELLISQATSEIDVEEIVTDIDPNSIENLNSDLPSDVVLQTPIVTKNDDLSAKQTIQSPLFSEIENLLAEKLVDIEKVSTNNTTKAEESKEFNNDSDYTAESLSEVISKVIHQISSSEKKEIVPSISLKTSEGDYELNEITDKSELTDRLKEIIAEGKEASIVFTTANQVVELQILQNSNDSENSINYSNISPQSDDSIIKESVGNLKTRDTSTVNSINKSDVENELFVKSDVQSSNDKTNIHVKPINAEKNTSGRLNLSKVDTSIKENSNQVESEKLNLSNSENQTINNSLKGEETTSLGDSKIKDVLSSDKSISQENPNSNYNIGQTEATSTISNEVKPIINESANTQSVYGESKLNHKFNNESNANKHTVLNEDSKAEGHKVINKAFIEEVEHSLPNESEIKNVVSSDKSTNSVKVESTFVKSANTESVSNSTNISGAAEKTPTKIDNVDVIQQNTGEKINSNQYINSTPKSNSMDELNATIQKEVIKENVVIQKSYTVNVNVEDLNEIQTHFRDNNVEVTSVSKESSSTYKNIAQIDDVSIPTTKDETKNSVVIDNKVNVKPIQIKIVEHVVEKVNVSNGVYKVDETHGNYLDNTEKSTSNGDRLSAQQILRMFNTPVLDVDVNSVRESNTPQELLNTKFNVNQPISKVVNDQNIVVVQDGIKNSISFEKVEQPAIDVLKSNHILDKNELNLQNELRKTVEVSIPKVNTTEVETPKAQHNHDKAPINVSKEVSDYSVQVQNDTTSYDKDTKAVPNKMEIPIIKNEQQIYIENAEQVIAQTDNAYSEEYTSNENQVIVNKEQINISSTQSSNHFISVGEEDSQPEVIKVFKTVVNEKDEITFKEEKVTVERQNPKPIISTMETKASEVKVEVSPQREIKVVKTRSTKLSKEQNESNVELQAERKSVATDSKQVQSNEPIVSDKQTVQPTITKHTEILDSQNKNLNNPVFVESVKQSNSNSSENIEKGTNSEISSSERKVVSVNSEEKKGSTSSEEQNNTSTKKEFHKEIESVQSTTDSKGVFPKDKVLGETTSFANNVKTVRTTELIKEIKNIIQSGEKHTVSMKLTPESFGTVKVLLETINNVLTAKIEVESDAVKQIIQSNVEQLRQSLSDNGIHLSNLNVTLANGEQKSSKPQYMRRKNSGADSDKKVEAEAGSSVKPKKQYGYNTYEYLV
ncbi:MAG: flagellar hook-length control protein FliK [Ignavibacteriaceae bacterium]|nr:flagellar hook-length control protein FliK [Ignavibacteriaceae bacterium]